MPPGKSPLDARLSFEQPVHGAVEFVGRGLLHAEFLAEGVAHGLACESAGGGELGSRLEDAGRDHGQRQRPFARGPSVEESFDAEASGRAEDGGDVAVRSGAQDLEGGLERRQGDSSLEQGSESFDELVGPLGEVGESAFLDLSVLSVGLSQQDGWW